MACSTLGEKHLVLHPQTAHDKTTLSPVNTYTSQQPTKSQKTSLVLLSSAKHLIVHPQTFHDTTTLHQSTLTTVNNPQKVKNLACAELREAHDSSSTNDSR
jgi:hypothetical protein